VGELGYILILILRQVPSMSVSVASVMMNIKKPMMRPKKKKRIKTTPEWKRDLYGRARVRRKLNLKA
jgi:hypothetical protein